MALYHVTVDADHRSAEWQSYFPTTLQVYHAAGGCFVSQHPKLGSSLATEATVRKAVFAFLEKHGYTNIHITKTKKG